MPSKRDAEVRRDDPDLFGPEPWGRAIADGFLVGPGWRPSSSTTWTICAPSSATRLPIAPASST